VTGSIAVSSQQRPARQSMIPKSGNRLSEKDHAPRKNLNNNRA
jgi:hypothetical protein